MKEKVKDLSSVSILVLSDLIIYSIYATLQVARAPDSFSIGKFRFKAKNLCFKIRLTYIC